MSTSEKGKVSLLSPVHKTPDMVSTFDVKGGNLGGNQMSEFLPFIKANINKSLNQNDIYLPVKEAGNLLGITVQAVRKNCKTGKYSTQTVRGNGGTQYEILLSSLPQSAQAKYWEEKLGCEPADNLIQIDELEVDAEIYASAPDWAREKADKYLTVIKASEGVTGKELKAFITAWNKKYPEMKTSYPRLLAAKKAYEQDGITALLANYGKRAGDTKVSDDDYEYFKAAYLQEGAPSQKSCWLYTLGRAKHLNPELKADEFPSVHAFIRKLRKEVPEQAEFLARYGYSAWNRKYANYLDRDYCDVKAGSTWVSDHAQVDVAVTAPDGKVYFPWVTVWRDFKSSKWLGWDLHIESPNSDHIFVAFYRAASFYGIPEHIYIDNGKDYRSKDFAGGRRNIKVEADQPRTQSMCGLLNIIVHFANPYGSQSKPVERDFLTNKLLLSKHMVGYRGGNVIERPEKLADEIKKGKVMTFEYFKEIFDSFITDVLNRKPSEAKNLKGKSPDQLWSEEFREKRAVSKDALKLFCTRTSTAVSIGRNGVRDSQLQVTYWAEWMSAHKGTKVYIRRDVKDYGEAWVFDAATDSFMGKAEMAERVPALADTAIGKQKLKDALASKKRDRKITEAYIKTKEKPDAMEQLMHLKTGTEALSGGGDHHQPSVNIMANTEMDKVVRQERESRRIGTFDISLMTREKPQKKKLYLFEADKEDI
jgi:transposase InsO family protein